MRAALFLFLSLFVAACGPPRSAPPGALAEPEAMEIRDGWAAPTPGGVDVSAAYLTIVNVNGGDDRLTGASSPRAERIEVHEMSMDDGVMRMRAIEGGLAIPAGATVTLGPGGQHLMCFGVSQPFAEGEQIHVTLRFERRGEVPVELTVRRPASEHSGH